jgi:hypothetical protein
MRILRLDTSFSDDATCCLELRPGFWGLDPANYLPVVLRPKLWNPAGEAYPLCLLHDPDACHHPSSTARSPSPRAPAWLGHFDLVNTVYAIFSCTLARRRFHVLAIHGLPRHLVPRSKPPWLSFTAAGPSAWTRLTFSIAADCLNAQHLHSSLAKRHVALHHIHAKISLKLNQSLIISLTIIQHSSHMDTSTMCSQNVRFVAWITSSRGHVSCTQCEKSWTRCMTDKFIWFSPIYQYIYNWWWGAHNIWVELDQVLVSCGFRWTCLWYHLGSYSWQRGLDPPCILFW